MTWLILIRSDGQHYEYWSAELDSSGNYTGRVRYNSLNRLYQEGREHVSDATTVANKVHTKLRSGYTTVSHSAPDYRPTNEMIRNAGINRGDITATPEPAPRPTRREENISRVTRGRATPQPEPEPTPEPAPTPVQRVEARLRQARNIATGLKTSRDGLLKKYRSDYQREIPGTATRGINYEFRGKQDLQSSATLQAKAKEFYDSIPPSKVYIKPPFGFGDDDIFGRRHGAFVFVFKGSKVVGTYEIRGDTGISAFLYLKTTENNYVSLLREMLTQMVRTRSVETYTLQFRGEKLKEALLNIFPTATIQGQSRNSYVMRFQRSLLLGESTSTTSSRSLQDRWQDL